MFNRKIGKIRKDWGENEVAGFTEASRHPDLFLIF
jgi:hypothetical protein